MEDNSSNAHFNRILGRLALLALVVFIMYLFFGDEDQAVRNTVRAVLRGLF